MIAFIGILLGTFVLLIAPGARADSVRYDTCSEVGESCDNAVAGHRVDDPTGGLDEDQAVKSGTCQNAKCQRPGPDGTIIFDCKRCIEDGDADGDDEGCSCRTTGVATPRSLAVVMLFAGVVALAWSRRRRS